MLWLKLFGWCESRYFFFIFFSGLDLTCQTSFSVGVSIFLFGVWQIHWSPGVPLPKTRFAVQCSEPWVLKNSIRFLLNLQMWGRQYIHTSVAARAYFVRTVVTVTMVAGEPRRCDFYGFGDRAIVQIGEGVGIIVGFAEVIVYQRSITYIASQTKQFLVLED